MSITVKIKKDDNGQILVGTDSADADMPGAQGMAGMKPEGQEDAGMQPVQDLEAAFQVVRDLLANPQAEQAAKQQGFESVDQSASVNA